MFFFIFQWLHYAIRARRNHLRIGTCWNLQLGSYHWHKSNFVPCGTPRVALSIWVMLSKIRFIPADKIFWKAIDWSLPRRILWFIALNVFDRSILIIPVYSLLSKPSFSLRNERNRSVEPFTGKVRFKNLVVCL